MSVTVFTRCCQSKGVISTDSYPLIPLDGERSGRKDVTGHVSMSLIGWNLSQTAICGGVWLPSWLIGSLLGFRHSVHVMLFSFVSGSEHAIPALRN